MQLCRGSFRLDPLKPPLDAIDPSEKRRCALLCCGVEISDLAGRPRQVADIQLGGHFVLFGLRKEPAEPQRLLEEGKSRIERALPVSNAERDLSGEARTDMVVAPHTEGVKAQRLLALACDGNHDGRAFDTIRLPT